MLWKAALWLELGDSEGKQLQGRENSVISHEVADVSPGSTCFRARDRVLRMNNDLLPSYPQQYC
jgi:hypothetical protein